ncbi:MAG: ATP-binding protein [Dehalococcoidia bacterium]|nr:ATP-binding protein [Dehalococcoidia bacterium]
MLVIDPPDSGKALLARSAPSILPRMILEEALEATRTYSVSGFCILSLMGSGFPA